MAANSTNPPAAGTARSPLPPVGARPPRHLLRAFFTLLAAALLIFALWTWAALSWSYSEGDRAGVLQKFSRKGWLCKTWEGEVAQFVVAGVAPQIWTFSVRDGNVAAQLSKQVGEKLQMHYTEHRGVPTSCFADTSYFVESFAPVK